MAHPAGEYINCECEAKGTQISRGRGSECTRAAAEPGTLDAVERRVGGLARKGLLQEVGDPRPGAAIA
jgi:hypothetical protein